MPAIERDQDDCTCDPPESPTPLGAALCPLHGWDALRRQVVRLSLQHQGAVATAADAISLAEHLVPYAPQHERARFFAETAELRKLSIGAVRERDTALVDRARLVAEVERLRSDAWKWRHLAADAAADLNRREREITRLEAQLQGAVEALYTAHDFIGRVSKWTGDTEDEQAEVLAEIARHLPQRGAVGHSP